MRHITLFLLLFGYLVLFGCNSPGLETPPVVSANELPIQSTYHIRTRIVIEHINFYVKELGIKGNIAAIKFGDLKEEIRNAHEIYQNIGIKLYIEEVTFVPFDPNFTKYESDAENHPNTLSIYYMFPNSFPVSGLGATPWMTDKRGIFIASDHNKYTLAHEIGHYFGLLHTFEKNDHCDDTEQQSNSRCAIQFLDANCGNIMNYCIHTPKFLTKDQEERVRRFLRSSRVNHIVQPDIKELSMDELMIISPVFPIEITD